MPEIDIASLFSSVCDMHIQWKRWCPGRESYATTDTTNRCLCFVSWRKVLRTMAEVRYSHHLRRRRWAASLLRPAGRPGVRTGLYFVIMGLAAAGGVGAAGEMENTTHAFHPSGRFWASNSL